MVTAAGCGSTDDPATSGFALSADQLSPVTTASTTTTDAPAADDPGRWDVEVATASVPVVTAFCAQPEELTDTPETTAPPAATAANGCAKPVLPAAAAALSDIPGTVPNVSSAQVPGGWTFNNPTYFGNPLVFLVLENHGDWLEVMVPTRPNGQTGWIRSTDVELSSHRWHAEIDVSDNQLQVWNGDELVAETGTVDGKVTTPTPLGRFYYSEKIEKYPESAYGSWILATNAYSDSLESFDGGLPAYATHGTPDDSIIGTDISNGCTRVPNPVIERLAAEMPMGTPVDIVL